MKIYYREKSGGIEILRCFGIESRVEIPGMIDDKLIISAAPVSYTHLDVYKRQGKEMQQIIFPGEEKIFQQKRL